MKLAEAPARSDVLRLRHALITGSANATAGKNQQAYRQLPSELMYVSALMVRPLRERADNLAPPLLAVPWAAPRVRFPHTHRTPSTPHR